MAYWRKFHSHLSVMLIPTTVHIINEPQIHVGKAELGAYLPTTALCEKGQRRKEASISSATKRVEVEIHQQRQTRCTHSSQGQQELTGSGQPPQGRRGRDLQPNQPDAFCSSKPTVILSVPPLFVSAFPPSFPFWYLSSPIRTVKR